MFIEFAIQKVNTIRLDSLEWKLDVLSFEQAGMSWTLPI